MQIPLLHGNWVDFIIIIFLLFSTFEAWHRGFVIGLFDFAGFALSFLVALRYYSVISFLLIGNFSFSKGIADAVGFFVTALIAEIALSYLFSYVILYIPGRVLGSKFNRLLGVVPPIATALVTTTFVLSIALSLPIRGSIKEAITQSRIGGILVSHVQIFERKLGSIFKEAAIETLNFMTIAADPSSKEKVDLQFTQHEHTVDMDSEATMLFLVNQERVKEGLPSLVRDDELTELSRVYATDMFEKGFFSHYNLQGESPFDRMDKAGISYVAAGENLALTPTVAIAHQGLMDSPGHRANILSPDFGRIGIGVIDGGIYGKMFVQEFTN